MKKTFSIIVVCLMFSFLFLQIVLPNGILAHATATGIDNPLNVNSLQDLIAKALEFVVNLLAIAGVVYIIWTGFMFVKAQGNPEELSKAKTAFFHAIIGMAIILGAWSIATVIANTINNITKNQNTQLGVPSKP